MKINNNKPNVNYTEIEEVGVPDFQSGTRSLNPRYKKPKKHKSNKSV